MLIVKSVAPNVVTLPPVLNVGVYNLVPSNVKFVEPVMAEPEDHVATCCNAPEPPTVPAALD